MCGHANCLDQPPVPNLCLGSQPLPYSPNEGNIFSRYLGDRVCNIYRQLLEISSNVYLPKHF